jgi:hypothetical protein
MVRKKKIRYRSGLEEFIANFLKDNQKCVRYEELKIPWIDLRHRTYTPDFVLDNGIIIETKGFFDSEDRRKHMEVRKQYPKYDIRFVFSNTNNRLYKGSRTTYGQWCEKHKFRYAHRVIPLHWLNERRKKK